jgi:tetratricopeptide (TPR) repeat protein
MRNSFETKSRSWIELESKGCTDPLRVLVRRSSRILAAVMASALLLASILAPMLAPARASGSLQAKDGSDDYDASLNRFVDELARYRGARGEASSAALEASAREMCERFERCEALAIVEYYRALSPEERHAGWLADQRYREIWASVSALGASPEETRNWKQQRTQVLGELRELIELSLDRPDFVPAAQALALASSIETRQVEKDTTLDEETRRSLESAARKDATYAIELFARAGQSRPQLEPIWTLGQLALLGGDTATARKRFDECIDLAERVRRTDFRLKGLEGLLATARWLGDAREQDQIMLELARVAGPDSIWSVRREWATRLLSQDHAREALEQLEQTPPNESWSVSDASEWNLLAGSARLRLGNLSAARAHFERLQDLDREMAVLALGMLAIHEHRPESAIELLQPLLEQNLALQTRERTHSLLGEAMLATGDEASAIEHLRTSVTLALSGERDVMRAGVPDNWKGSAVGERLGLHTIALLAEAIASSGEVVEAVSVAENTQSRYLREPDTRIDADSVLRWAAHAELGLVTWVVGHDFTFVGFVGPDGRTSTARIPHGRVGLERAVRRLREAALARNSDPRLEDLSREISTALLPRPIANELRRASTMSGPSPRLLVLAHGPTELLPFELLPWEEIAGRDDVVVVALPGLPTPDPGRCEVSYVERPWRLLGSPLEAGGTDDLRGAREELTQVATLRPGSTAWLGARFTPDALDEALRSGDPIHIATHFVHESARPADRRWRVALATSTGGYDEDKAFKAAPRLPIVVLSGCGSGDGEFVDAEGQWGLARMLLKSGTRNVVVTQWPVEDSAATAFGVAFHRALLSGCGPSRAVAQARRELAAAGLPPADWAAFRLLGRD